MLILFQSTNNYNFLHQSPYSKTMADPLPNQLMTCPYNPAHQVEQYRMHIHLNKCRKQHQNCNKVLCPFDTTHVINDVELEHHVSVCPKRAMLDTKKYILDNETRPPVEVQSLPTNIPCEENWEEDGPTSYVPDLSKKPSHIITKIKGATPSERRKHRMECVRNYKPTAGTE